MKNGMAWAILMMAWEELLAGTRSLETSGENTWKAIITPDQKES